MIDRRPWEQLAASMGGRLSFDAPLAGLSGYGLGGPAAVLARPESAAELRAILEIQISAELPVHILGGGSNTLFTEAGFKGLVVRLGSGFDQVEDLGEGRLRAGAGAATAAVLAASAELGLSGLEGLAGIPGRFGGALMMNAGSFGRDLGPAVESVFGLDGWGREFRRTKAELNFEYRRLAGLPEGAVLLEADLSLARSRPEEVRAVMAENLKRRSASQPQGRRSAGSVFKNPPGLSAGRLIEECGFKGLVAGGAEVSPVHANFIVVRGRAESADILELIDRIRAGVYEQRGVVLELEIKIVGPAGLLAPAPLGVDHERP